MNAKAFPEGWRNVFRAWVPRWGMVPAPRPSVNDHAQHRRLSPAAAQALELLDWVELGRLSATGRAEEVLQRACDLAVEGAGASFCAALAWRGRALEVVATAHGLLARAELPVDQIARRCRQGTVLPVADGQVYAVKLGRRSLGALFVRGSAQEPDPVVMALAGFCAAALARAERERSLGQAVREAKRERDRLAARVEALERLGSRASHDLKAPLVAIKGYVDMILRGFGGPIEPKATRYLEKVNGSVDRMKELIDSRVHPSSTRGLADLSLALGGRNEALWVRLSERDLQQLRRTLKRCGGAPSVETTTEGVILRVDRAPAAQARILAAFAVRAGGQATRSAEGITLKIPRALR